MHSPLPEQRKMLMPAEKQMSIVEVVELLKQYDMNSSIGAAHHFSIADATGKSAVVEYVNGEMLVTETNVVTNHYLADCAKKGVGSEQSHQRFDKLSQLGPDFILSDWRQQGRPICYSERLVIGNGDFFKANVPVPISLKFPSRMYAVRPLVYNYIAQMQRRLIGRLWEKFAGEDCVTSCA